MIEHRGIVERIGTGTADILIIQMSACASCHAKNACSASDMAEKIIRVSYHGNSLKKGDEVIITGAKTMGWKAVAYAFILPFIALMTVLIIATETGLSELYAGLAALGALAPYYLILYLFREKLKNKFTFTIKT